MSLLNAAFLELTKGLWWQVLPLGDDDEADHIAAGIGIEWANLLPFLLNNGLVYTQIRSTVNCYLVSKQTRKTFCLLFLQDKLQLGFYADRKQHMSCTYFVCCGKPQYPKPVDQIKGIWNGEYAFLELKQLGNLSQTVAKHVTVIRAQLLYHRFHQQQNEDLAAQRQPQLQNRQ